MESSASFRLASVQSPLGQFAEAGARATWEHRPWGEPIQEPMSSLSHRRVHVQSQPPPKGQEHRDTVCPPSPLASLRGGRKRDKKKTNLPVLKFCRHFRSSKSYFSGAVSSADLQTQPMSVKINWGGGQGVKITAVRGEREGLRRPSHLVRGHQRGQRNREVRA